jgi:hypothetical protein
MHRGRRPAISDSRPGAFGFASAQCLSRQHEATYEVADDPVGHVVGADFVYDQQSAGMLMSGVLLKEIDELVRSLRDGTGDGELKSRLCVLIFLISQLPHGGLMARSQEPAHGCTVTQR